VSLSSRIGGIVAEEHCRGLHSEARFEELVEVNVGLFFFLVWYRERDVNLLQHDLRWNASKQC
jgi:hypothetical protein